MFFKKLALTVFISLLFSNFSYAADAGSFRLGGQAGHTGLLRDVGNSAGNALGYGAYLGFAASDDMLFETTYSVSKHTDLEHSSLNLGASYIAGNFDMANFFWSGGVDFTTNKLTNPAINLSSNGFGLFAGGGLEFEMGSKGVAGVQALYHFMFDTSARTTLGTDVKTVQDYVTVMFRFAFVLGGKGGKW